MPASEVNWPVPLTRLNPVYPGQVGVEGGWTETGLRQHSTGAIFWVDPNCPYTEDRQDGTDPEHPMTTVAAALARCQPYRGDVVAVMAANYWPLGASTAQGYTARVTENVTVSVAGVRIVGVFPSSVVGVPWIPATAGGTCITVNAVDVLIEGFSFLDTAARNATAIHAVWGGAAYGDNLTVRHCHFNGLLDYGVRLTYSYYSHIHDCRFQQVAVAAIQDVTANNSNYADIHRNFFDGCANAVKMVGATYCNIRDNWVMGDRAGTDNFIDLTGAGANMVANNWLGCTIAPAEYATTSTAGAGDAWVNNHCMDGDAVVNP